MTSSDRLIGFIEDVVENPQLAPLSLDDISEKLKTESEEGLAEAVLVAVTELGKPNQDERDAILILLAKTKGGCRVELLSLFEHDQLSIRSAAVMGLGSVLGRDLDFDPFGDPDERALQIDVIRKMLDLD